MTVARPCPPRLAALDGLRGVAAVVVALFHFASGYPLPNASYAAFPLLSNGTAMVALFFLLSGYVMEHVYGRALIERPEALRSYLAARVARLYPLHLATLAGMVALHLAMGGGFDGPRHSLEALGVNLLMLQGLVLDGRSWNYPAWSISIEFAAYLLFPLALLVFAGLTRAWLWAVLAALLLASAAAFVAFPGTVHGGKVLWGLGLFLCGALLRRACPPEAAARLPGGVRSTACWALLATAGALLWMRAPNAAFVPVFAGLIALAAAPGGSFAAVFGGRALGWLGDRSYGVYMIHALVEPVLLALAVAFAGRPQDLGAAASWALVAVGLALTLALADASYRRLETPARRWVRARLAARPPARMPAE